MTRLTSLRHRTLFALRPSPARVDAEEARERLARGAVLLDVRRQDDLSSALEGAVRIPPDELPSQLARFDRDTPIVLACT